MEINKFIKKKNGMYRVIFSDFEMDVHEDLILKYNLLLTKDLTDEMILKLKVENLKYKVYDVALKELKKRLRSKMELKEILMKKGYESSLVDEVILLVEKQGYLNDSLFVDSYIHDQIMFSSTGPLKIRQDLVSKGIDNEIVETKISTFTEEVEKERITKIINKNLKNNKKSLPAFKMHMRQILNRLGYHLPLVDIILSDISFDDDDFKRKEYEKLYRRLSKKYSGIELEKKIKQKLYQKGFYNSVD